MLGGQLLYHAVSGIFAWFKWKYLNWEKKMSDWNKWKLFVNEVTSHNIKKSQNIFKLKIMTKLTLKSNWSSTYVVTIIMIRNRILS